MTCGTQEEVRKSVVNAGERIIVHVSVKAQNGTVTNICV